MLLSNTAKHQQGMCHCFVFSYIYTDSGAWKVLNSSELFI